VSEKGLGVVEKLIDLFNKHGAGAFFAFVAVLIVLFIAFLIYKKFVKSEKTELVEELKKIAKTNAKVASVLSKGYLTSEHTEVVRSFSYGKKQSLRSAILKRLMEVYEAHSNGKFNQDAELTKKIVFSEIKSVVISIDEELFKLPSIEKNTLDPEKKIEIIDRYIGSIVDVMIMERRKDEVRKRLNSILESVIVVNRF
jgi:hypothetical protein